MFDVKDELLKSVLELQAENEKLKFKNENLTKEVAELKEKFGRTGRKSKMNSEQKEEIKYLYETKTATMDEIAKNYGCSKALIHKIIHEDDEKTQEIPYVPSLRTHRMSEPVVTEEESNSTSRPAAEVLDFIKDDDSGSMELILGDARSTFEVEGAEHLSEWLEDCVKYATVLKRMLINPKHHINAKEFEEIWLQFPISEIEDIKDSLYYLCDNLDILNSTLENTASFLKQANA